MYAVIGINRDSRITEDRSHKEWGGVDTDTDWNISDFFRVFPTKEDIEVGTCYREIIPINITPKIGEIYYLLYAVYSTGDSFSHQQDGEIEIFGLYESEDEAYENLRYLDKFRKDKFSYSDHAQLTLNGEKIEVGMLPWLGYFERLSYLRVHPMIRAG